MFDRRTLFGAAAAAASFVSTAVTGRKASAAIPNNKDVEPRGAIGRFERLPTQNVVQKTMPLCHRPTVIPIHIGGMVHSYMAAVKRPMIVYVPLAMVS